MKTTITKKIYSFIIMMVFSISFASAQTDYARTTINPIIGDISFVTKFGYPPDETRNEDLRIATHLEYAENLLRQKDASTLSLEMQQSRARMLDLLHDYWTAGKFPRNYDYKNERRPCFIDKDKTICAVGYLVEQTAGREAAEAINIKYKYEDILAMNDALVDSWVENSGLTKTECAMIQPQYNYCYCTCTNHVSNNKVCYLKPNGHYGCRSYPNCKTAQTTGNPEYTYETLLDGITPNPVSSLASVWFTLEQAGDVSLKIYDVSGRLVTILADDSPFEEGDNEIVWNASDVKTGIYFLRMETANYSENQKLIVTK